MDVTFLPGQVDLEFFNTAGLNLEEEALFVVILVALNSEHEGWSAELPVQELDAFILDTELIPPFYRTRLGHPRFVLLNVVSQLIVKGYLEWVVPQERFKLTQLFLELCATRVSK